MESARKELRGVPGVRRSGGFAAVAVLGLLFSLAVTGILLVGSAGAISEEAPYREGPLGQNAGASSSEWLLTLPPNADEFFALVCLVVVLVGFRWAGLSQRDRISR